MKFKSYFQKKKYAYLKNRTKNQEVNNSIINRKMKTSLLYQIGLFGYYPLSKFIILDYIVKSRQCNQLNQGLVVFMCKQISKITYPPMNETYLLQFSTEMILVLNLTFEFSTEMNLVLNLTYY